MRGSCRKRKGAKAEMLLWPEKQSLAGRGKRGLALWIAALLMVSLCGCGYQKKARTEILESGAPSGADFSVLSVTQVETEKEGQALRYVGLSGQSMVAVWGREESKRLVLVGKSGYLKPCTEEMAIIADSVICRGEHILFEAKNGEERVDIFLLDLEDESVRKIGSYLADELVVPVGWQDGDISFASRNISGIVLSRYDTQSHTLERMEDIDIYRGTSKIEQNNATLSRMFLTGNYAVIQLEIGTASQIAVEDLEDAKEGSIFSAAGFSPAAAGGRIYYIAQDGALMSWKADTREEKKIWDHASFFVVSADGSKLAVVEKGETAYKLYVVDIKSGQALYVDIYQGIRGAYLSEDGSALLVHCQSEQTAQKGGIGGTYTFYELGKEVQ